MSNRLLPDMNYARDLFGQLDKHWAGPKKGMVRRGYSPQETEAMQMVGRSALSMGMGAFQDLAGNSYFIHKGQDSSRPALLFGSHLDAVPQGGRYDGPAGVVAGMMAVKYLADRKMIPPQDICVVAWRNEESPAFNQFAIGSHLATGQLKANILDRKSPGGKGTLDVHMRKAGVDTKALQDTLASGRTLLPIDRIGAAIEVHIEQGKMLASAGMDIGIVTDIRGNTRTPDMLKFYGTAGHTGSVPQNQRSDAAYAAMLFGVSTARKFETFRFRGNDLVFAYPEITTGPDVSPTKIPNFCAVRAEIRSTQMNMLEAAKDIFLRCAIEAARESRTVFKPDEAKIAISKPASMSEALQVQFEQIALRENIRTMRMASGAGHDSGVLSLAGVQTAMLFLAHEGRSHVPQEIMTLKRGQNPLAIKGAFSKAVTMLSRAAMMPTPRQERGQPFADALMARGARPMHI